MSKRKAFAAPSLFAMPAQSEQAHTPAIQPAVKQTCRFENIEESRQGSSIAVRCTHNPVERGYCAEHTYVLRVLDTAQAKGYPLLAREARTYWSGENSWQEEIVRMSPVQVDRIVAALEDMA